MNNTLKNLTPAGVFHYFEEISDIPRASRNTKPIADYLENFAKERSLKYIRDEYDNVIIEKEASEGCKSTKTLIIQGHTDMVAEKNKNCSHNFANEPLSLKTDGDYIYADNTTLGGDDGIAVAYALALLDDSELFAPKIKAIFTSNEEIGLLGATALDAKYLEGDYLLNIDSEEEGILLNSCAGGAAFTASLTLEYKKSSYKNSFCIEISGLLGGHSGTEIDKYRANAGKILGNLLLYMDEKVGFDLVSIDGGTKDNAIMREASAMVLCDDERLEAVIEEFAGFTRLQYQNTDSNINISVHHEELKEEAKVLTDKCRDALTELLSLTPDGVLEFENVDNHYVQTSLNMGIIDFSENTLKVTFLVRSSIDFVKENVLRRLKKICKLIGAECRVSGEYPGWASRNDSELIEIMKSVYLSQYGEEPVVEGVHAGLECGIFYKKNPKLDIVSFGPNIYDIHTPNEHLSISSTSRVWYYIVEVLMRLSML